MEMDLADFVDDILALKRDKSKAWKKTHKISLKLYNKVFILDLEYKTFK